MTIAVVRYLFLYHHRYVKNYCIVPYRRVPYARLGHRSC